MEPDKITILGQSNKYEETQKTCFDQKPALISRLIKCGRMLYVDAMWDGRRFRTLNVIDNFNWLLRLIPEYLLKQLSEYSIR